MVRASASVDLAMIPLSSHIKDFQNGVHRFPVWCSATRTMRKLKTKPNLISHDQSMLCRRNTLKDENRQKKADNILL